MKTSQVTSTKKKSALIAKSKPKAPKLPDKLAGVLIQTPMATIAFPKLFKPEPYKGKNGGADGEPKYGAAFLFDADQDISTIEDAIEGAMTEAFGKDKKKWPEFSSPLRDGNEQSQYEGYENKITLNASSKYKPTIWQRTGPNRGEAILDENEVFGGRECDAKIIFKVTESGGKIFVTAYLQGVRFVDNSDEAERLGGGGGARLESFTDDDIEDLADIDDADTEDNDDDTSDLGY